MVARTGRCASCGQQHAVEYRDGRWTADKCGTKAVVAVATTRTHVSHFNSKATACANGHLHQSKAEARACRVVSDRFPTAVIYRNVRLPLWALPPTDAGIPMYCNVDFVVRESGTITAIIDAKCGKRSRDWARGRAAVEASYGIRVEELEV